MLERIKNCICHPRFIGKYHKDKFGKILFVILIFFFLYILVFGFRTFTENPIGEDADKVIVKEIISEQNNQIAYDSNTNTLTGESVYVENESFGLYILPKGEIKVDPLVINIILEGEKGYIYYGEYIISEISYSNIKASSFSFENISDNNSYDIYNFRYFINGVLESSFVFFRVMNLVTGIVSTIITFMMLFLVSFIFARIINPTIEGKVRAKLALYDTIIFLVCAVLTSLFNQAWIIYLGYSLPAIYTAITFKHIIRVVIPKK